MTENGIALAALNREARRRKTTYGDLVAHLTKKEQEEIIKKYRATRTRRKKNED